MSRAGGPDRSPAPDVTDASDTDVTDADVVDAEIVDDDLGDTSAATDDGGYPDITSDDPIDGDLIDGDLVEAVQVAEAIAAERDEYLDMARRVQADFENYKRRVDQQRPPARPRQRPGRHDASHASILAAGPGTGHRPRCAVRLHRRDDPGRRSTSGGTAMRRGTDARPPDPPLTSRRPVDGLTARGDT